MRKVLATICTLVCCALGVLPCGAQSSTAAFKDLPAGHWAYSAADQLRARGVITGYPEAYFKGRRALTRYEFALAIDRVFSRIAPRGERSPGGDPGAASSLTDAVETNALTLTSNDVELLRRLATEFQNELAIVGTTQSAVRTRLERLSRDIEAQKQRAARAARTSAASPAPERRASAPSRTVTIALLGAPTSALSGFETGRTVRGAGALPTFPAWGDRAGSSRSNVVGDGYTSLQRPRSADDPLALTPSLATFSPVTSMNVDRYRYSLSRLSLVPPQEERHFTDPGAGSDFGIDGMHFATHVGSVVVEAFAGQAYTVSGTLGMNADASLLTPSTSPALTLSPAFTSSAGNRFSLRQLGGVSLRLPVGFLAGGHIRLTSIGSTGLASNDAQDASVFGAETELRITPRITLGGEWARTGSSPQAGLLGIDGNGSAYSGSLGFRTGPIRLTAEYKYIDPLFYAPGYWGRIGGWLNPTNIQGPGFRAAYEGNRFGLTLGGDFYSGARNRDDLLGFGANDDMTRVLVGVRWDLSRNLRANLDWEGVYWRLNNQTSSLPALAGNANPREQYVTISTGYNLSNSTLLRLGYQRGGLVNGAAGSSGSSSISTFTGQMAIKF